MDNDAMPLASVISPWLALVICAGFTEAVWGHPQQGFMVSLAHWDSVSSMPIVITDYSYDLANFKPPAAMGFNGDTNPITTVGISLEIVFRSPSKRSTSISLALL